MGVQGNAPLICLMTLVRLLHTARGKALLAAHLPLLTAVTLKGLEPQSARACKQAGTRTCHCQLRRFALKTVCWFAHRASGVPRHKPGALRRTCNLVQGASAVIKELSALGMYS